MQVSSDGYIRSAERHKIIRQAVHHCQVKIERKLLAAYMLWLEMHFVSQHHLNACMGWTGFSCTFLCVCVRFKERRLRVCSNSEIRPHPNPL